MLNISGFLNDGIRFINSAGAMQSTVTKYSYSFDSSDYDDVPIKTLTGSISFSGLIFPIHSTQGSSEALMIEQGKLKTSDKVLYCGSISLDKDVHEFLINGEYYNLIENGIYTYSIQDNTVYNKLFIRHTQRNEGELI